MTAYSLLIFLHVLGAVGMFAAWGAERVALAQLGRVLSARDARDALALRARVVPVAMAAMLIAVATGVWMMIVRWGPLPWEASALAALVGIAVIGIAANRKARPVLAALRTAADGDAGPAISELRRTVYALERSLHARITVGVAILALMSTKPGVIASTAIVASAAAVALLIARSSPWTTRRAQSS